jgi:tetratricopeptide (TPR) repeat protein
MGRLWRCWFLGVAIILGSLPCWEQAQAGPGADKADAKTWQIFGHVSTIRGEPIDGALVRLYIGSSTEDPQKMETNLKGEFYTEVKLDSAVSNRLRGTLIASKEGYIEGRETLDLRSKENYRGVHIVLGESIDDPEQISMASLVSAIAPDLRNDAEKQFAEESSRSEFVRGCEELIDQHNGVAAVPLLDKSVERMQKCLECRLLLSLALLNTGSWTSANNQLEQAFNANNRRDRKRPEPAFVMGVLEAWQGHFEQAVELYQYALEADPKHALALKEMGRALLAQKNWEPAEQYFNQAFQAGADEEVRLLRVRALLELNNLEEAEREIDRYAAGRKIKDLPQEARALHLTVQNRLTLLLYGQVKSMTVQSPEELMRTVPELQGLDVVEDQSMLEEVLKRTGEGVDAFFKNMPNTASLEQVHQERLGKDGDVRTSLDQEFFYIMEANPGRPAMGIKEYRSTPEGNSSTMAGSKEGLMLTSGFASTSSLFHPANRGGADFRYLGKQTLDGHEAHVIAFAQNPQTARMVTRFVTDEGSALILTHGLAWIDAQSFQIVRLYTSLLDPVPNLRLRRLTTEIKFHHVSFAGSPTTFWLPQTVEIMVDWHGRILRNRHRYSDFKLFRVEAKEERKPVIIPNSLPRER